MEVVQVTLLLIWLQFHPSISHPLHTSCELEAMVYPLELLAGGGNE